MENRDSFANILTKCSNRHNPLGTSTMQCLADTARILSERVYPITAPGVKKLFKNVFDKEKTEFSEQEVHYLEFLMILRALSYSVEDAGNITKKFIEFKDVNRHEQSPALLEFVTDTAEEIKVRLAALGRTFKSIEDALEEPLVLKERMEKAKREAYNRM